MPKRQVNMPHPSTWRREPRECKRCHGQFAPKSNRHDICEECKRCVVCGKSTGDARKRYCGRECYAATKRMDAIACARCGAPVPRAKSRKAVYCSRECRNAVHYGKVMPAAYGYLRECTAAGWIYQHRVVMERVLGRRLARDEVVHHRNGVKTDNRPENLELCLVGVRSHPPGQRVEDLVAWAEAIVAAYGPVMTALERKDSR